jgi:uncharacterized protein
MSTQPSAPPQQRPPFTTANRINLIYFLLFAFVLPVPFLLLIKYLVHGDFSSVSADLGFKLVSASFAIFATWYVARREKRPLADYGLPTNQIFGARFWEGIVWGFAMLSLLLFTLNKLGAFHLGSVALNKTAAIQYALGWGLVFLGVSFHEELTFRGYFLFVLARARTFWPAALILSLFFGAAHIPNPGETLIGILHVFITGLVFCFMIRRTGTLWFVLGYHASWDWAESYFYGTPDSGLVSAGHLINSSYSGPTWLSGGSAGPEGSLLSLFLLLLCALLLHLRFPKPLYPTRPI